ncbi:exopolysaccharide biosynthesis polyprenyl glycosylphosphotransferase [Allokutzneria albata]|uniref:Exopolysaccharide biosynthesis polyprenyl glycosylphosphotransferase n=1 Tax=Allokutzneria albata TaxID=211114 RepID=A0A1H0CF11_ALLAB|nr:exopolysaccharide biosynthesis polyprenyl glycosylphosphotransferase [Allokutzneria albata]
MTSVLPGTSKSNTSFAANPALQLPKNTLGWEQRYQRSVIVSDICAIVATTTLVAVGAAVSGSAAYSPRWAGVLAGGAGAVAVVMLSLCRAWDVRVLGQGPEEFRRVGRAAVIAMLALSVIALAVRLDELRPWVFVGMPALAVTAVSQRYLLRKVLHARRREGSCLLPVLAAGTVEAVHDLIRRTRSDSHIGWRVEAVCTPDGLGIGRVAEVDGVPVVGNLDELVERTRLGGYRVVAVAPAPEWTPDRVQRLAWDLEGGTAELVVTPTLMEVAGPRLHVAPVFGLTMLWVSAPTFSGIPRLIKAVMDRVGALVLTVLAAPVLLLIAAAIKLDDGGPVFYRQYRVGRGGQAFPMLKFRSMVVDAHQLRHALAAANQGSGPLFKMRRDPRVTRVGAVLRRYSLDELPQVLNVLFGSMSLVGPRPPLAEEVASYGQDARRKLLVKPGMTGLWQVSGRSDLSWEESVRIDLRYVESWSLSMDLVILWKTVSAVVGGKGAY